MRHQFCPPTPLPVPKLLSLPLQTAAHVLYSGASTASTAASRYLQQVAHGRRVHNHSAIKGVVDDCAVALHTVHGDAGEG